MVPTSIISVVVLQESRPGSVVLTRRRLGDIRDPKPTFIENEVFGRPVPPGLDLNPPTVPLHVQH